jgi:hypothetical protein
MIVIHSRDKNPEKVFWVCRKLREDEPKSPICLIPTTYGRDLHESDLFEHCDVIVYANVVMRKIIKELKAVLEQLRRMGTLGSVLDRIAPLQDIWELVALEDHMTLERKFAAYRPDEER